MAALVTEADVRQILDGVDPSLSLQSFIDQADLIVTEDLAASNLTPARLKMIELNLAAHFFTVAIEHGGLTLQRAGYSEERYQLINGVGFASTRYGQQAIAFDTSGTLAAMANPAAKAEFRVVSIPDTCSTATSGG